MERFDFRQLFILDLANNHQGDVNHGLRIIKSVGHVVKQIGGRAALKFQFRQLDTFIHPDYRNREDFKHIPRFISTQLRKDDFARLTEEVRNQGMTTMCTPFDEPSVEMILELGIEIIKVASCSATDWPLLECIAMVNRPIVVSTAGLLLHQIDRIVSFFKKKRVDFAIMHCVAIYPTPAEKLNLNYIGILKNRYPDVPIGFSTHEDPNNFSAVRIACAKGAELFERHIGIQTDKYKLNAYSSTPEQIAQWMRAYYETIDMCGGDERAPAHPDELNSLHSLMRGVFAEKKIKKGQRINRQQVFFAMPLLEDKLPSSEWFEGMIANRNYMPRDPLDASMASLETLPEDLIYQIMLQVQGMLNNAKIFIGQRSSVEISHHYGLERFREYGCVTVNCINRTYCKKLLIQLPRQKHPYHYHKKKEETFQLISGDLELVLDGKLFRLDPGDTVLVQPNQWHKFHTLHGAIVEEVSTTHYNNDSFYQDQRIAMIPREQRKTTIPNWGTTIANRCEYTRIISIPMKKRKATLANWEIVNQS
jgi:N-acetylneuraminate synthase